MFDRAIDELWLRLGIGPGYMKERHGSTFTAECHVRYLREIHLGDPVQVSILLVAADEKRLHTFEELRHATEGWLSATSENMTIHIDMTARKTAPFPSDIRARVHNHLRCLACRKLIFLIHKYLIVRWSVACSRPYVKWNPNSVPFYLNQ